MQCHYCDDPAAVTAESNGITVGLCEDHFQERLAELADDDAFEALQDRIDVDSRQ